MFLAPTGTAAATGPPDWASAEASAGTAVRTTAGLFRKQATWPATGIGETVTWATAGIIGFIVGGTVGATRDNMGVGAGV